MQKSIETMHTELEERLRFETLLAETSARFVNVPAGEVDREIEGAQRRICELLDLDHALASLRGRARDAGGGQLRFSSAH